MKKEDIFLDDWQRILTGEAPTIFMAEVLLRTVVIYLMLLIILRLREKRMTGQLTISEMAVPKFPGTSSCLNCGSDKWEEAVI